MTDEIVWINHAGYELRTGGLRIVHDPWLFGSAFGNGWSLIAESRYTPADFAGVDYLWFSHEHPDHFSPAVLKAIPEDVRRSITILFQETRDGRVVKFCKNLGFEVRELKPNEIEPLNDHVRLINGPVLGGDSWLYMDTGQHVIFNANDCVGVDWHKIHDSLPKSPDTLLTQFSYANWVGNAEDVGRAMQAAADKIGEMRNQIAVFQPQVVIPFASYVWFSHRENFHMNAHANSIGDIARTLGEQVQVAVLYPGDVYALGQPLDNASAIARYEADIASHTSPIEVDEPSVQLADLRKLADREQARLHRDNAMWMLRPLQWGGFVKPIAIYLTDLQLGIRYSMFGGIARDALTREECALACSSSSFAAMLRNGYGYNTLSINGRFHELLPGASRALSRHFAIAARNEEGESIPGVFLNKDYVMFQARRALHLA